MRPERCRRAAAPRRVDGSARLRRVLADAEHLLGCIAFLGGRTAESLELLTCAAERVAADDPARAARVLADTVEACLSAGDASRAEATAQRAWELSQGEGGSNEIWAALRYGDVLGWQGEVERAAELWLHAAAVSHAGDPRSRCAAGEALFSAGDDERASTVFERVVTESRATGSPGLLPYALHSLGLVETRRGRLAAAIEADAEAAELAGALGQSRERLMAVGGLAWTAALLGRRGRLPAVPRGGGGGMGESGARPPPRRDEGDACTEPRPNRRRDPGARSTGGRALGASGRDRAALLHAQPGGGLRPSGP